MFAELHPTLIRLMHRRVFGDVRRLHLTLRQSDALTNFRFVKRLHSNDRMHWRVFRFLSKNCIWRWNDQMHWRVFEFLSKDCIWFWNNQMHWRIWRCQKNCTLMIECIDELTILPKNCIWRWNEQMHWLIWRWCQKNCIWFWNSQIHWQIFDLSRCLDYRCSGEVFDCLMTQTGCQADRQTNRQTKRQMRRCLLTVKADKLIREKWWKTVIQSWNF